MQEPAANPVAGDAVTREKLHTRSIVMDGYRRSDGLFEIEARLVDSKTYDFRPPSDVHVVKAGDAIHDLRVNIVFDADFVVRESVGTIGSVPYEGCDRGPAALARLVGLKMSGGWTAEVRRCLSGAQSCQHLMGMMVPIAAAAFQTATTLVPRAPLEPGQRPPQLDTCIAYSRHGSLVKRHWPTFHIARADEAS